MLCLFPPQDTEKTVPAKHMGQATHLGKTKQEVATGPPSNHTNHTDLLPRSLWVDKKSFQTDEEYTSTLKVSLLI